MPKKNKMEDLRDHLFETIEMLKDPDSGMDIKTAKQIAEIGRVLVDSARVEVDFQRHVGGIGTNFIEDLRGGETQKTIGSGGYINGGDQ